jgi:LGFP repeat-containing protein
VATLDDLWRLRWSAINAEVPYVAESGIATFWRAHPELGSPLAAEIALDDGGVAQAFANGIVRWSAEGGPEQV